MYLTCKLTTQITTWSCCHYPFCHRNNLLNHGIHTRHSCHLFRHHCKLANCIWTMPLSLSWCIAFWLQLSLSPHHILQFHTTLTCIHTRPLILSLHITFQPTQFGTRLSPTHSMTFQYHPLATCSTQIIWVWVIFWHPRDPAGITESCFSQSTWYRCTWRC